LRVGSITARGELLLGRVSKNGSAQRQSLVAIPHLSNSLGTLNPVREITRLASKRNIPVLVDEPKLRRA